MTGTLQPHAQSVAQSHPKAVASEGRVRALRLDLDRGRRNHLASGLSAVSLEVTESREVASTIFHVAIREATEVLDIVRGRFPHNAPRRSHDH
jgi:hypothetical protein